MSLQQKIERKPKKSLFGFLVSCLLIIIAGCEDKIDEWKPKSENQVITEYVAANSDQFSEFYGILEITGIKSLLRVRGPFTLLLPTNTAMEEFYKTKNVSSYTELDSTYLRDLIYNHLFPVEIATSSIGFGALPEKNALGDYITSEFSGSDIILNKKAKIIKRDVKTSNGYVQHIDKVLDLVTDNIFNVLAATPGYSIFLEGLEQTKIKDTLQTISFPYGEIEVRAYFTILAVPDTLYNRYGINNINDLINKYSTGGDLTDPDNGFYRYMEYHCLSETYYLSDFSGAKVYPVISFNSYLNIDVRKEYKINEEADTFTTFYLELSNIPAKNGAIHTVSTLLPYAEAKPATVIFETTDYFDLKRLACYGKYYRRFYDGQNTFEGIKWEGDYLMYYYKQGQNLVNDDGLSTMGYFWIELTTPKIMKGKYKFSSFWFGGFGTENASFEWYLDGAPLGVVTRFSQGVWGGSPVNIAEVEFTETKQHTVKIVSIIPGAIWWDRLIFTPI
jgi:uncharacterized surface protein with fasciclin (FAS1) repeats